MTGHTTSSHPDCTSSVRSNCLWGKKMPSAIDDLIQKDYERLQHYTAGKREQSKRADRSYNLKQLYSNFNEHISKLGNTIGVYPMAKDLSNEHASTTAAVVPLTESSKTEVFKLSVIDRNGCYTPPSPPHSSNIKRDHWIEVYEDEIMDFWLPSRDCLTVKEGGKRHEFYTPSTVISEPTATLFPIFPKSTITSQITPIEIPLLKESQSTSTIGSTSSMYSSTF